jgi:hypothetical protein
MLLGSIIVSISSSSCDETSCEIRFITSDDIGPDGFEFSQFVSRPPVEKRFHSSMRHVGPAEYERVVTLNTHYPPTQADLDAAHLRIPKAGIRSDLL